jgi:phosphate transport system substrate-binding protein
MNEEMQLRRKHWLVLPVAAALALGVAACGDDDESNGGGGTAGGLTGEIAIDGSSTVFPFAQAATEQFQIEHPDVRITVGQSGTGGGFEKFCAGETDVSDASRPIDPDEEAPLCERNGVAYKELEVAADGIAVVTNPSLEVDCLTTAQLERIWQSGSRVASLADVDPELPSAELSLYGPGTDSGTFEFFTEEINGEEGATRKDYQPSEDDNVLVQGVTGDEGGLAYFGFSYAQQNADRLNVVAVDGGSGCVEPSLETIQSGEYAPLSRPLYMYPSEKALRRPEVRAFMEFVLENAEAIADAARIVPTAPEAIEQSKAALAG